MDVLNLQSHPPSPAKSWLELLSGWCQSQPWDPLDPVLGPCVPLAPSAFLKVLWGALALSLLSFSPSGPKPPPVTGLQMAKDPHHTVGPAYNPILWGSCGCRQPEIILNLDRILGAGALDSSLLDASANARPLNPVRVTTPPCGHFWKCTGEGRFLSGA